MGGAGDIGAKIKADVARTEMSANEISTKVYLVSHFYPVLSDHFFKVFYHTEGKLVRIPGLPVMHEYEFFPQKVWPI